MTLLDSIGEATLKFLQRVFYYSLGFLIRIIEFGRSINKKVNIYGIFEKRGVEFKDYVILESQSSMLIFLLVAIAFIFDFFSFRIYVILALIFGSITVLLLINRIKRLFEEYNAYRDFFLSYLGIAIFLVIAKIIKPTIAFPMPYIHLVVLSLFSVIITSMLFKRKYGRVYTFGRVLDKTTTKAKIKVNYDICSGVRPGIYSIEGKSKAKKGSVVKLKVEKRAFGLKGAVPIEIIDVLKEEG